MIDNLLIAVHAYVDVDFRRWDIAAVVFMFNYNLPFSIDLTLKLTAFVDLIERHALTKFHLYRLIRSKIKFKKI